MRIEAITQCNIGDNQFTRVGDVLNDIIANKDCKKFRFAVAFMRLSGLDRLSNSIDSLINRGGEVSAAIGIDQEITSIDALEAINSLSKTSTIVYTVSNFIYHPKLYVVECGASAIIIVGSANLTLEGLFRNIELCNIIYLDLNSDKDFKIYKQYDKFLSELLNTKNSNVKQVNNDTIKLLASQGLIKSERELQVKEIDSSVKPINWEDKASKTDIGTLFPPLHIPVAPPAGTKIAHKKTHSKTIPTSKTTETFIMQLSSFDSSHRTGVKGTPEIIIPHPCIDFFPPISEGARKYPDVNFNVILNTPTGREIHQYRLWYYEYRATGKKIDEYRLRMDNGTIDLSTQGGGDLLVINKLPKGTNPSYEVTILSKSDPTYITFLNKCNRDAQGKRWGII